MITSQKVDTQSIEETLRFGERLSAELRPGDVLALSGDLGAGKTALIKGVARGLGVTRDVTSPTFTLVHEYSGGHLPLFHIDLYRLDTIEQALAVGIEDYFGGSGVTAIEWAEKIESLLPENTTRIRITTLGETARRIEVA